MEIILQTKKGNNIENETYYIEINSLERIQHINELQKKNHPKAIFRRGMDRSYNCHGLTFANRRTCIFPNGEIIKILKDDEYKKIEMQEVMPGDVIIYKGDDDDIIHSGIVVQIKKGKDLIAPIKCVFR